MSLLKLHNIGKIYNSNDVLTIGIRNINLEFDLNEFVVIEGESGYGKSTLLSVIGANDTYEEGEPLANIDKFGAKLDYTMADAGGVSDFKREYTMATGGDYCDCGYYKK